MLVEAISERFCTARVKVSFLVSDVVRTALILGTIAVATPAPAQDAGVEPASQEGAPPYTPISSQPAESPSRKSPAWWSRVMDGHLALGAGTTYQYDGSKGSNLGVATWTSNDDHYELAAFRFFTAQMRRGDPLAEPNWIFEASRRWRLHWKLIDRSGLDLFFGVGAAYKTKTDCLDGSNWNFAEQLGWRFPQLPSGGRLEFAFRHVSNAGLKKPNKGEDFLTVVYVF